jgi:multidrug efflux system outer membrane protein
MRYIALLFTLTIISGCANEKTRAEKFSANGPDCGSWIYSQLRYEENNNSAWWREFSNPQLDFLIQCAVQANKNILTASTNIFLSRAARKSLYANDKVRHSPLGIELKAEDFKGNINFDFLSADIQASWERKLFGADNIMNVETKEHSESAVLSYQATEIAVVAEMANSYLELQGLMHREAVIAESIDDLSRCVELAKNGDIVTDKSRFFLRIFEAEMMLELTEKSEIQSKIKIILHGIELMLGGLSLPNGFSLSELKLTPPDVPRKKIKVKLLERRFDVLRQAHKVDFELARLGVAKHDVYPYFEFDLDTAEDRLRSKASDASVTAPTLTKMSALLKIFDKARAWEKFTDEGSTVRHAMLEYERAMLGAIADAKITLDKFSEVENDLTVLENAYSYSVQTLQQEQRMFRAGRVDVHALLDAHRSRLRAHELLLQGQVAKWIAAISIRRAFAGGIQSD